MVSVAWKIDSTAMQQHQVENQRDVGDEAEHVVVERRRDEHGEQAEQHRAETLADVVLAEARADDALLDDVGRCGERAGAQQQRQFGGFFHAAEAGGVEAVGEHAVDRRRLLMTCSVTFARLHFLAVDDFGFGRTRSMKTTAMRLPTFWLVKSSIFLPPAALRRTETAGGRPADPGRPTRRPVSSPETMIFFFSMTGIGFPSGPFTFM